MPLWKIQHPVNAYTVEDKKEFSENITAIYSAIPIPKFYVVTLFQEVPAGCMFVGGEQHDQFVRFNVDHMARTLPTPVLRRWWVSLAERVIAPFVKERGLDWEITFNESPADLWSIQGEIPPPFESVAEKRWVAENKPSRYTLDEQVPHNLILTPGVAQA